MKLTAITSPQRLPWSWRSRKTQVFTARIAFLLLCLGLWESAVRMRVADPFMVSSPTRILQRFWADITAERLLFHSWITLQESLLGLLLGAVVGVGFGLMLARWSFLSETLSPFIYALNSLPRVALAPVFIMWVGIGLISKVLLAFSTVVVILLVNTTEGARNTDPVLVNVLKTMGAREIDIFREVILPSTLPWILAGLRVGLALSFIGAVAGELVASTRGIGYLIMSASGSYDMTGTFVPLLTLALIAWALNGTLSWAERKMLRWRPPVHE